jgi:hypothetical protein
VEEEGKLYIVEKRKAMGMPGEGYLHGEATAWLARNRAFFVISCRSLFGPKLDQEQKLEKLSIIDQVLVIGGP